jgi:tight adherence protein B
MEAFILFLVFIAVITLVLGIYTFLNRERLATEEATREQLRALRAGTGERIRIIRDKQRSSVPLVDMLLRDQPLATKMEWELARAGLSWSVGEFALGSLVVAAAILLIFSQLFGLVAATIGMIAGFFLLFFYVRYKRKKREERMEVQLPDAVDMIVNAMRAGFSLQAAMQFVGQELPQPLPWATSSSAFLRNSGSVWTPVQRCSIWKSALARSTPRCSSPRCSFRERQVVTCPKSSPDWPT